ncbi:MAG TPA: polysaccharide deacetylase family protein [Gammaproteobacteria bacterium]|nr:polysaccharide deacetylase family protein [Gammaproteobacteria bacterium]
MQQAAGFRRLGRSLARLAHTHFPPFLFGLELEPREIPVFAYHDVDADVLRCDLDFLERNGYRTLSIEEYYSAARETGKPSGRRVLLTFDDARRNFWEVAVPILEERGARATVFVPTFWIRGARFSCRPEPPESDAFMTWEQVARCEESYLIDVESHSHRHALVYTSASLVGFASPAALARHDLFDWPLRRRCGRDEAGFPPLGTPIYEAAPLLSAHTRMLEPEAAADACRLAVEAGGREAFFASRDWAARLKKVHDAAVTRTGGATSVARSELGRQVEAEIQEAVAAFERELGRKPRFFAYPWMLGSPESLAALADVGVCAAFGVGLDFRRARSGRAPLPVFARYKCDWIRFLPGLGRRRLQDVLPEKVAAFFRSQHLAH